MTTFPIEAGRVRRVVPVLLTLLLFCLPAWGASSTVVISQIYTAGGNSGATYNADFVEIFNLSSGNVSLDGFALQYMSAAGTSAIVSTLPSGVTLAPGQRYLVRGTASTTNGAALPSTADYVADSLAMGAAAGRIYLTSSTVGLSGTCPTANVVDFVGYGTTAACFEGTKYAPAPSTSLADLRTNSCKDTDDNGVDFATGTPSPRNSSSAVTPCGTAASLAVTATATPASVSVGKSVLLTAAVTAAAGSPLSSVSVTADLSALGGSSAALFHDDGANGDLTAGDGTFSFSLPIGTSVSANTYTVTVRATDTALHSASSTVTLTVTPAAAAVAIHTIQGSTPGSSAYNGLQVIVSGIVTGVKNTGFFLQARDADADKDPNTSEGIFVYTGTGNVPATAVLGNELSFTGKVNVYTGSSATFPNVELDTPTSVTVLSTANPLPTAVTLTAALPSPSGGSYQLYRMQSMRVAAPSLTTTQGTDGSFTESTETYVSNGIFWGTVTGVPRPAREPGLEVLDSFTASQASTIPRFDDNPEVFQVDSLGMSGRPGALDVTSSTVLTGVTGIVDFSSGTQTVLLDASDKPVLTGGTATTAAAPSAAGQVTVAELNMERFYNDVKDTAGAVVITTEAYKRRMSKASLAVRNVFGMPDILALEEVENLDTLTALAKQISSDAVAAGQTDPLYAPYLQLGNDSSGISVGFLVKPAKVNVLDVTQFGKDTTYTNATGAQATLNDRPPLVLHAGLKRNGGTDYPLTVIVNHLRSLNGVTDPSSTGGSVRLKREAQAEYLAKLIQGYQAAGEHVISVGDYNAFEFNDGLVDTMGVIRGNPAASTMDVIPGASGLVTPALAELLPTDVSTGTYTYVFAGNVQSITHFLTTQDLVSITKVIPVHLNADFPVIDRNDATTPNRTSDHDGEIGYITVPAPPPSLSFAPGSSLTFGSTVVGSTSTPQTVTVSNKGSAAISITSIVASSNFVQTNTCGNSIAAGGSCTIAVSFAPATAAALTGSVVLTDSDVTGTQTIALTGTGAPATASVTLVSSAASAVSGTSVQFTATVTGNSAATPAGQVNFLDGTTQIGTAMLSAGSAKYSTAALGVGPHTITAVYTGSAPYPAGTSNAVAVTVTAAPAPDFSLALPNATLTVNRQTPSQTAVVNLAMSNGFNSTVSFTCSGLPAFSSCSFSPGSLSASGSTTLTVTAFTGSALLHKELIRSEGEVALAVLSIPVLLGFKRKRRRGLGSLVLGAVLMLGFAGLVTGCSDDAKPAQSTPAGTSSVTITATGGGLTRTATVSLVVQ